MQRFVFEFDNHNKQLKKRSKTKQSARFYIVTHSYFPLR